MATQEQTRAALDVLIEIARVIRASGPLGCPSGPLYARLMGGMDLDTYTRLTERLKSLGLVRESNHCLFWIEQPKDEKPAE